MKMRAYTGLVLGVLCLIAGAVAAQPTPEDTWLTVQVFTAEGAPFTSGVVMVYRFKNDTRIPYGKRLSILENKTSYIGLSPGPHELMLSLPGFGLSDGPKSLDLLPGANRFSWRLPPMIPVEGDIQKPGEFTGEIKQCSAYLLRLERTDPPAQAYCVQINSRYRLRGVLPGKYRLLLVTDAGYGVCELSATEEQSSGIQQPVKLKTPGTVTFQVTDEEEQPLANAAITLRSDPSTLQGFVLNYALRTDASGKVTTPSLPLATWQLSVNLPNFLSHNTALTIMTPDAHVLPVSLQRREKPAPTAPK
ncbi:MAG: hypothetical protein ACYDBB_06595 [Armatimonadota bacterium]